MDLSQLTDLTPYGVGPLDLNALEPALVSRLTTPVPVLHLTNFWHHTGCERAAGRLIPKPPRTVSLLQAGPRLSCCTTSLTAEGILDPALTAALDVLKLFSSNQFTPVLISHYLSRVMVLEAAPELASLVAQLKDHLVECRRRIAELTTRHGDTWLLLASTLADAGRPLHSDIVAGLDIRSGRGVRVPPATFDVMRERAREVWNAEASVTILDLLEDRTRIRAALPGQVVIGGLASTRLMGTTAPFLGDALRKHQHPSGLLVLPRHAEALPKLLDPHDRRRVSTAVRRPGDTDAVLETAGALLKDATGDITVARALAMARALVRN